MEIEPADRDPDVEVLVPVVLTWQEQVTRQAFGAGWFCPIPGCPAGVGGSSGSCHHPRPDQVGDGTDLV